MLGNYVVLEKIGQGGMSHVYKAEHKRMKRVVALKVLPSTVSLSKKAVRRFQQEVEAAAMLNHQNVVTAYDADEADGYHFLVMEYVDGIDLAALVERRGPLPVEKALDYTIQAAEGLQYAHGQGVVHRDIKPSNLLLSKPGTVKILDMGLARFEREVGPDAATVSRLTQVGKTMGTIDYMSPEQAQEPREADHRSDVYSLGCTLYYLLTAKPVFPGATLAKILLAHQDDPPPSLCAIRRSVPAALDEVFRKAVAKKAEDRYDSMTELIADLEACRASRLEEAGALPSSAKPSAGSETSGSLADRLESLDDLPLDELLQGELPEAPTHIGGRPRGYWLQNRWPIILACIAAAVIVMLLALVVASR